MAVRVRVEIEYKGRKGSAVALANSGYESREAEVLVPFSYAKEFLRVKGKGKKEKYLAAGRTEVSIAFFGYWTVRVVTESRSSNAVTAKMFVSHSEDQVILNDVLTGLLGLALLDVKEGRWRFMSDSPEVERASEAWQTY